MVHGFEARSSKEKLAYILAPVFKQLSGLTDESWTYSHTTANGLLTVHDSHVDFGNSARM